MFLSAICVTYLRPRQLGRMIYCFLQQDYPADLRELVILDDAGQYDSQQGNGWRLISIARRFRTLGEKRNAAVALAAPRAEALAVWDDDDLYLPWALSASAAALRHAAWSRPSLVLHPQADGTLVQHRTGGLFHGGWAYRRDAFRRAGGYPAMNNGEDQGLARRLVRLAVEECDPCSLGLRPFYVYPWGGTWHLSNMGADGYQRLGALSGEKTRLDITPPEIDVSSPRIVSGIRERLF